MKKLVIAGGTGFLGELLSDHFTKNGYEVTVFTRQNREDISGIRFIKWNGRTYGKWVEELDGVDVLINLSGKSVNCRYTPENKEAIYDSRINSTYILGEALQIVKRPPKIWLNASSATIYRDSVDEPMTEKDGVIGSGFSVDVCKKWENTFFGIENPGIRKVALRLSVVLGKDKGGLKILANLCRIGLGGAQGGGKQSFAWIHEADVVRSIEYILENKELEGPINVVAPNPVSNSDFMTTLRKQIGFPFGIPIPKILLVIGAVFIKTEAELILKSRNVIPQKLLDHGFQFKYKTLKEAMKNLV